MDRYAARNARNRSVNRDRGKERSAQLSLGSLATIIVAVATFSGYLVAYGWRSGEAFFYGIPSELVSVSIEDALRFSVPLVMVLSCWVIITVVDVISRGEEKRKYHPFGIAFSLIFMAIVTVGIIFRSVWDSSAWSLAISLTLIAFFVVSVVLILRSMFSEKKSMLAAALVGGVFMVQSVSDHPALPMVIFFIASFVVFGYIGYIQKLNSEKRLPQWIEAVRPSLVGGSLLAAIALMSLFSFFGGNRMAQMEERIVLSDQYENKQIILTTYAGNRSITGNVDEDGNITSYQSRFLTDESGWHVEPILIKGNTLLSFSA